MATISWVIMKHHKKADGTFNPKIRIIHNRSVAYLPTQIFTPLVRFKRGEATGTPTDGNIIDSLNDRVKELRNVLNTHADIIDCCENAKSVVSFLEKKMNESKNLDFLIFAASYVDGMKNNGGKVTASCVLSNLRNYVGGDILPVRILTSAFLRDFEAWLGTPRQVTINGKLRLRQPLRDSSIQTYMNVLQTIYNRMLQTYNDYETGDIVITKNPFVKYSPKRNIIYKKKAVDAAVIRMIANYQPPNPGSRSREFARDMFILSFCLAGMNLADLLTCDNYSSGRLEYCRMKTKNKKKDRAFISLPVPPEAQQVFDKYRDPEGKRVFDLYKTFDTMLDAHQCIGYGMKAMCKDLGIEPITFYAARHSFATIARNDCSVSMEDVALCLTHRSGFNMTDTYVKPDFSRVDQVIRKVMDFVFGKEGAALSTI